MGRGAIPQVKVDYEEDTFLNKDNKRTADHRPEDVILGINSDFAVAESYKSIRTNIMYSMPKSEVGKVIAVTSASAGEGKTTTSINLAITFAQMDKKILLIDCDLRKPKVHRYLKFRKNEGISNVLCGFTTLDKVINQSVRTNLDVITSGDTPPNPVELLHSEEFMRCINVLRKVYDYIIIDTPPVGVVTDAAAISKISDGVILLVKKEYTTFDMMDIAMERLKTANANLLGTVMIDSKNSSSFGNKYKASYGYRGSFNESKK